MQEVRFVLCGEVALQTVRDLDESVVLPVRPHQGNGQPPPHRGMAARIAAEVPPLQMSLLLGLRALDQRASQRQGRRPGGLARVPASGRPRKRSSDHHDAAATTAVTRLNLLSWYEARVMNKTRPARTPITMDVAFMRPASRRARAIPVPPTMQFTAKIAEDVVNTTPRHDDRVPISSSSWTAVRSVGCGKKCSAPGSSVA